MKKTSTKPKGATSYKETKFGIIPRSKLLPMEIEGTKKGLDYIFRLVSKDKSIEITPELICQLHQKAFGWIFPKWAGKYRKIQVTVSGNEAPSFYLVPEMMMNLCEDLKARLRHLPNRSEKSFIIEAVFNNRVFIVSFIRCFRCHIGKTGPCQYFSKLSGPALSRPAI